MPNNQDFLAHYGVKGQKWGVRRYQNEDGTLKDAVKKNPSGLQKFGEKMKKAATSVGKTTKKTVQRAIEKKKPENLSKMSDQELRDRVNRMQTEANYRRLVSELNEKPGQNKGNNNGGGKNQFNLKKSVPYAVLGAPLVTVLATQAKSQYTKKVNAFISEHAKSKIKTAAKRASRISMDEMLKKAAKGTAKTISDIGLKG